MFANSRIVTTSQTAVHPRLGEFVARHLREPYRRRPSALGRDAFAGIVDRLVANPGFLVDAGCGTGESAIELARRFPDRHVLGIDKSAVRLATGLHLIEDGDAPGNVALLHCELVDFWQLAATAGLFCGGQFLLYPNPWPKPEHVMRRWHAHPVLPALLALGGPIELRTNWRVYAEEFAQSLRQAGWKAELEPIATGDMAAGASLTPFERKYAASRHALWRCLAHA